MSAQENTVARDDFTRLEQGDVADDNFLSASQQPVEKDGQITDGVTDLDVDNCFVTISNDLNATFLFFVIQGLELTLLLPVIH